MFIFSYVKEPPPPYFKFHFRIIRFLIEDGKNFENLWEEPVIYGKLGHLDTRVGSVGRFPFTP